MIDLIKNRYVQLVLVLGLGIFVGNLFKNTTSIEERIRKETVSEYQSVIQAVKEEHLKESESLKERISSIQQENKLQREEYTKNIESLRIENSELKQKVTKKKIRIVKHDGTIIEKEFEESETEQMTSVITSVREEFKRKVESIEQKWSTLYRDRLTEFVKEQNNKIEVMKEEHAEEITRMQREYSEKTNEKKFRPEIGADANIDGESSYYGHISYPIWGPLIMGTGADTKGRFRIGLGLEF